MQNVLIFLLNISNTMSHRLVAFLCHFKLEDTVSLNENSLLVEVDWGLNRRLEERKSESKIESKRERERNHRK